MKRYLVFAGDNFYPSGGWGDFRADADDPVTAIAAGTVSGTDWWQVVDSQRMMVVYESTNVCQVMEGLGGMA